MLRKLLALILVYCLCLSAMPTALGAQSGHGMNTQELELLRQVNRERAKHGLHPLTSLPELQRGSEIRANELPDLFSHTRPDGRAWYSILQEISVPGMKKAGENLAGGYSEPADALFAWMNSEGHRRNVLDEEYAHVGHGFVQLAGTEYGNYWTQIYFVSHRCQYTGMTLEVPVAGPVEVGTGIDEMEIIACLNCAACGSSYLPVLAEYCSGYNAQKTGTQKVTVSCLGMTASFTVSVGEETAVAPAPDSGFSDLASGSWYAEPVEYMVSRGLMNGVGNGRFDPDGSVTRSMMVTILYRAAGSPSTEGMNNPFADVPQSWYTDAVVWAANKGIVNGVSSNSFQPEGKITREQIAAILYRYDGGQGSAGDLSAYSDASTVSGYARQAMAWATSKGIINGVGNGSLAPTQTATRAQIATMLARYLQQ